MGNWVENGGGAPEIGLYALIHSVRVTAGNCVMGGGGTSMWINVLTSSMNRMTDGNLVIDAGVGTNVVGLANSVNLIAIGNCLDLDVLNGGVGSNVPLGGIPWSRNMTSVCNIAVLAEMLAACNRGRMGGVGRSVGA